MPRSSGQVRIIEAVLATFMIVAVILLVMAFTRPLRSIYLRETSDLRRLAYNLLSSMAQAHTYERVLAKVLKNPPAGPGKCNLTDLAFVASVHLPPGLVFYMDVYRVDFDPSTGETRLTWLGCASNLVDSREELRAKRIYEAEPIRYTYVCTGEPDSVRGYMIYIEMFIGYSG